VLLASCRQLLWALSPQSIFEQRHRSAGLKTREKTENIFLNLLSFSSVALCAAERSEVRQYWRMAKSESVLTKNKGNI